MSRPQRRDEILGQELPPTLPLMALRSTIVYPLGTIAVQMGAPENLALLRANEDPGLIVALVVATGDVDDAIDNRKFIGRVGVAARVHERINLPGDTVQITLQGLRRITIESVEQEEPFVIAGARAAKELPADPDELDDLVARIVSAAETLADLVDRIPDEVPQILKMNVSDPGRFADLAATNMNFRISDKDEVLQRLDVGQRLRFILSRLEREVARARVMEDVKKQTEVKIEQHQREFYLRQQLRAIQAELGETDPGEKEAIELLKKIDEAKLPERVGQEARRETERLRMLSPASSEYQVIRNYLDWILALPWHKRSGDEEIALSKVEEALDGRHYGLQEAKERIVEFLAVRKLRGGDPHGPILCFVGPPGTGKTSLGEAIATAIGRAFYRIAVGGVRDEAEIRGHRRTYVGAMPGLLLQALRRVGVSDPVLMIDEIDKMSGGGASGDPTAAMLEVLDPAQNHDFVDHYLNLAFDLSRSLFICTANNLFDIPAPLRDRMEVIRIAGYTVEEKVEIAWRYLLPRLLEEHGITDKDIQFTDEVLGFISSRYSREAGLRNFERNIATIMRKRARRKAEGRGRRVGGGQRPRGTAPRRPAPFGRGGREGARDRCRDRARVDVDGGRHHDHRGAAHGWDRQVDGHRATRRRDARVGGCRTVVRALARRLVRRDDAGLQGERPAHPLPGRGSAEGRPERRRRRHAGHRLGPEPPPRAPRCGDDGRSHAARQGAGDRRREGEDAGRLPRRVARGDPPRRQPEGPARRAGRSARQHGLHLRQHDGRGVPARVDGAPEGRTRRQRRVDRRRTAQHGGGATGESL
jgi:ATP-dependent Lon protease